jgi:hypothetical protein
MTLRSAILVTAILATCASTAFGQLPQQGIALRTSQLPPPRATGNATDRSDRMGQTYLPAKGRRVPDPKGVPNWHIPMPRPHGGR